MGLLRFDVEESRQKQRASRNAVPTTTRFARFQQNIDLYHRAMNMRGTQRENRRYYVAMINKLVDELGGVDSSNLAAEDRNLYEVIDLSDRLSSAAAQPSLAMIARLSAQSVVFEVLVMLLDEELIRRSALHDSVDLATVRDIGALSRVFMECFEFGKCLSHCPQEVFMYQSYAMPLRWLASMITRGAKVDLETILSTIETKKLFGAFDWDRYWVICALYGTFSVDPEASITDREETGYVGMHLPMGVVEVDVLSAVHDAFDKFDELVQTFQDLCGKYFGFSEEGLVPVGRSLEQLELLRRYNAGEEGIVWEDGHVHQA